MKLLSTPQPLTQALALAQARGVLPSALSSAEQREAFTRAIRQASVFSARTTNAVYLDALKTAVERALKAGYNNDRGQLRLLLKEVLQRLGYTPEGGFPGQQSSVIGQQEDPSTLNPQLSTGEAVPPAAPGSLRDLSSDKRINLILDTQEQLMHGAGQKQRGLDRRDTFPAWELIRIFPRKVPRGSEGSGTKGWVDRWVQAGGKLLLDAKGHTLMDSHGEARLIALKTDPVWYALGDSSKFDDALDVDHPPFAFNSGKGWREVSAAEWMQVSGSESRLQAVSAGSAPPEGGTTNGLPEPRFSASRMSPEMKAALIAKLKGVPGKITTAQVGKLAREVGLANSLLALFSEASLNPQRSTLNLRRAA